MASKKKTEAAHNDEILREEEITASDNTESTDIETDVITEDIDNVEKMATELEKMNNYAMRMKADLENLKKRNANIASEMFQEGKTETLMAIIPVIDSVDRALGMEMSEQIKEGLSKIKKQFEAAIEKLGVEVINAEGEEFDPHYHNALMQVEDEANSGKVVQVYEKGYKCGDKILRHASVVVAK